MSRLPILMYHHINTETSRGLTISAEKLERQLKYLSDNGYQTHHFADLAQMSALPKGAHAVITFDDAYVSQMELAIPLLRKYNMKATIFVPLDFIGKVDEWNRGAYPIMDLDQLKSLDPKIIELGHHSYYHKRFDELSNAEIEADMRRSLEYVSEKELNFSPIIAYPYGKFPKEKTRNGIFKKILSKNGMAFGLRIGNRINTFPFKDPFEIQRLDIKGEYSMLKFKQKLKLGKLF